MFYDLEKLIEEENANIDSHIDELPDYSGYTCDAISDIADSNVSIYTADLLEYAQENPDSMSRAACDFCLEPGNYSDWESYTEAVASAAWYDDDRAAMEDGEEMRHGLNLVAWKHLQALGYKRISQAAYELIDDYAYCDYDKADDLDEFREFVFTCHLAAVNIAA